MKPDQERLSEQAIEQALNTPCNHASHAPVIRSLARQLTEAEREVEEWKVEAERGKWPKEKAQEFFRYREALERIAPMQQDALAKIESNGFVFEDIGAEPGNWQHLAFTLYIDLCEVDSIVSAALDAGDCPQSPPRSSSAEALDTGGSEGHEQGEPESINEPADLDPETIEELRTRHGIVLPDWKPRAGGSEG